MGEISEDRLRGILDRLQKRGISPNKALDLIEQLLFLESKQSSENIPLSIFSQQLSALETIVKYLKENKQKSYDQIAQLTSRTSGSIGVTYRSAKKKFPGSFSQTKGPFFDPKLLQDKSLSVLEHIVFFLHNHNMSWTSIAKLLHRDPRTIGTIAKRIRLKRGEVV